MNELKDLANYKVVGKRLIYSDKVVFARELAEKYKVNINTIYEDMKSGANKYPRFYILEKIQQKIKGM